MADELTSAQASEETPVEGQSPPTSEETPQVQSEPSARTKAAPNLFESEEFRNYQKQRDRTEAQKEAQRQQEVAALRQELEAIRTKDMTVEERYQWEIQQRNAQLGSMQQQYQQLYGQLAQQQALQAIVDRVAKATGVTVPSDVIGNADGPDDAWEKGLQYAVREKEKELKAQQKQRQERKADAQQPVDLGTGSVGASSSAARQRAISEAKKSGNVMDVIRAHWSSEDSS